MWSWCFRRASPTVKQVFAHDHACHAPFGQTLWTALGGQRCLL
ncbi:hypothetical protein [Moraxella lacunata]